MRHVLALCSLLALSGPAAAQCEIDLLDPADPIVQLGDPSAFTGDLAVLADWGKQVSIFERGPAGWTETANFPSDGKNVFMPVVVEASNEFVVTGMVEAGPSLDGRAYVYERAQGWMNPTELAIPGATFAQAFGAGLALHDETLVVGASMWLPMNYTGPGKAFVFERLAGVWTQTAEFHPHGSVSISTGYGPVVATDGETVVVGSCYDHEKQFADEGAYYGVHTGAAYVYGRDAGGWVEEAKLFPSDLPANGEFGFSVAVEGDLLLVGSQRDPDGAVYAFERGPAGWTQTQILVAGDGQPGDDFGASVSISGQRAVVGAPGVDGAELDAGALYGFDRIDGVWVETVKIVPHVDLPNRRNGTRVDLAGNQVLWSAKAGARFARLSSLGVARSPSFCTSIDNSTGAAATIVAEGCDSVLASGLTLLATDVPPVEVGLFFFAADAAQTPFGNGFLCLAPPLLRLPPAVSSASGVLSTTVDFQSAPAHVMTAGSTWLFQAWFRDPGFGAGFGTSDAVRVALEP